MLDSSTSSLDSTGSRFTSSFVSVPQQNSDFLEHAQRLASPDHIDVAHTPRIGSIAPFGYSPIMSFRVQHQLLDEVYNSTADPEDISAKRLDSISRQVGLSMEEVLLWFKEEKVRRGKLEQRFRQTLAATPARNGPPMLSPEPSSAGSATMAPNSEISSQDFSHLQDLLSCLSPTPTPVPDRSSPTAQRRRGRPPKLEGASASQPDMLPIPESKRQRKSFQHPCIDCKKVFAAERWAEHVKRVHFPDYVWECPKTGCHAMSKPFYRPDNFATHLKGEHDCAAQEVSELKESCRFEVIGFFHKVCGFCNESLATREQSVEHIKEHFRTVSLSSNPPEDMGASSWRDCCGTEHVLTRGVHYQIEPVAEVASSAQGSHEDNNGDNSGNGQFDNSFSKHGSGDQHPDSGDNGDGNNNSADDGGFSSHDFEFMDFDQYSYHKDGSQSKSEATSGLFPKPLRFLKSLRKRDVPAKVEVSEELIDDAQDVNKATKMTAEDSDIVDSTQKLNASQSRMERQNSVSKTLDDRWKASTPSRSDNIKSGNSLPMKIPSKTCSAEAIFEKIPVTSLQKTAIIASASSSIGDSPSLFPAWHVEEGLFPVWTTEPASEFPDYTVHEYGSWVDPSLIHPFTDDNSNNFFGPPSPLPSLSSGFSLSRNTSSTSSNGASYSEPLSNGSYPSFSPYIDYPRSRRSGVGSLDTYTSSTSFPFDEGREKGMCSVPSCGKVFKDLKAHMLTHQNERPEKCPIKTCDYHVKGFARVYDKNRHTLTHFKGTLVCGFCPGSGSAAEKSFNRADVFKRHLTSVHAVEQTPPNSRRKSPRTNTSRKISKGYAPDATGKCSICTYTFSNAQDFYEHLDDCVLRCVQQKHEDYVDTSQATGVGSDKQPQESAHKDPEASDNSPRSPDGAEGTNVKTWRSQQEDDDEEEDDEDDEESLPRSRSEKQFRDLKPPLRPTYRSARIAKSKGMTHSRGGVSTKGLKSRRRHSPYQNLYQNPYRKPIWGDTTGEKTKSREQQILSVFHPVALMGVDHVYGFGMKIDVPKTIADSITEERVDGEKDGLGEGATANSGGGDEDRIVVLDSIE